MTTPTVEECGYPDFDVSSWFGMAAPAGTPSNIVLRLNAEFTRILASPELRSTFASQGLEPAGGTPEQFAADIASELRRWTPVVKALGIKLERIRFLIFRSARSCSRRDPRQRR